MVHCACTYHPAAIVDDLHCKVLREAVQNRKTTFSENVCLLCHSIFTKCTRFIHRRWGWKGNSHGDVCFCLSFVSSSGLLKNGERHHSLWLSYFALVPALKDLSELSELCAIFTSASLNGLNGALTGITFSPAVLQAGYQRNKNRNPCCGNNTSQNTDKSFSQAR